jgi:mono/diheme cytochrome c family protein
MVCRRKEVIMLVRSIIPIIALMACMALFGASQQKEIRHVPVKATSPASGPEMYTSYCAVCHGLDGKGNGPAAEALKVPPPDLTALSKKNGGKYPSDHVTTAIRGDLRLAAHGSKEMPVWGDLFWGMSQGHSSEVQLRVTNLNKYIESLQAK